MSVTVTAIAAFLMKQLADLVLGGDLFTRIQATVERWEEKEVSGLEKKAGVLAELEIIGIELSASMANWAIEMALQLVRTKA